MAVTVFAFAIHIKTVVGVLYNANPQPASLQDGNQFLNECGFAGFRLTHNGNERRQVLLLEWRG
ncbi:hypothetical protein DESC_780204 [Desulfosarcina cetonica]|nr:hypothetical protein DESC_780204 [Desulfosarcina cetonica]